MIGYEQENLDELELKGYCIVDIGGNKETMPVVHLKGLEAGMRYVMTHKVNVLEVIIEDEDESVILHAKDGIIVFPTEFYGR